LGQIIQLLERAETSLCERPLADFKALTGGESGYVRAISQSHEGDPSWIF